MDDFLMLSFRLDRQMKDFVENSIYNFDIAGFEVDDPVEKRELLAQSPEWDLADLPLDDDGNISYKVFFTDDEKGEKTLNEFVIFFSTGIPGFEYDFKYIDNSNWEDEWKKSYKSFPIGNKIWIKPSWEEEIPAGKICIEIEPKMAFGTGTHETTSLCMSYVENWNLAEKRVLDIGCGSAILSILAKKLGAKEVDACDIDPLAIENAKDNCKINGVEDVNVFYSDLFSEVEGVYDLIFANILAEIIMTMLDEVDDRLNQGGKMILSGIITSKAQMVIDKLEEKGFEILDHLEKGEWALIACRKKDV